MAAKVEEKILFVDDEPRMLASLLRQLGSKFRVSTAQNGEEALEVMTTQGPFAVVVSDFKMPGMDGVTLLEKIKEASPGSVRMLLTGYADLNSAIRAINDGNIFRFLTKPIDAETLIRALVAAIKQYRLEKAEKELLGQTLTGSIGVLTDLLGLLNPEAVGRSSRLRQTALKIAENMGLEETWTIETAASLSQLGLVLLSPEALHIIYKGRELEGEDKQIFDMHPAIAADLLKKMPRMDRIAEIILLQRKQYNGEGAPFDRAVSGEDIPLESRILKAVLDFDLAESQGLDVKGALERMRKREGWYDPLVLSSLRKVSSIQEEQPVKEVDLCDLTEVMTFAEDVMALDGRLVVPMGQRVNRLLVHRLKQHDEITGLKRPLRVLIDLEPKKAETNPAENPMQPSTCRNK